MDYNGEPIIYEEDGIMFAHIEEDLITAYRSDLGEWVDTFRASLYDTDDLELACQHWMDDDEREAML